MADEKTKTTKATAVATARKGGVAVPQNLPGPLAGAHRIELRPEEELLRHQTVAPCSLEFSRNAKGQATWTLKVYGERTDMDSVLDQVLSLDEELRRRAGGGSGGDDVS